MSMTTRGQDFFVILYKNVWSWDDCAHFDIDFCCFGDDCKNINIAFKLILSNIFLL